MPRLSHASPQLYLAMELQLSQPLETGNDPMLNLISPRCLALGIVEETRLGHGKIGRARTTHATVIHRAGDAPSTPASDELPPAVADKAVDVFPSATLDQSRHTLDSGEDECLDDVEFSAIEAELNLLVAEGGSEGDGSPIAEQPDRRASPDVEEAGSACLDIESDEYEASETDEVYLGTPISSTSDGDALTSWETWLANSRHTDHRHDDARHNDDRHNDARHVAGADGPGHQHLADELRDALCYDSVETATQSQSMTNMSRELSMDDTRLVSGGSETKPFCPVDVPLPALASPLSAEAPPISAEAPPLSAEAPPRESDLDATSASRRETVRDALEFHEQLLRCVENNETTSVVRLPSTRPQCEQSQAPPTIASAGEESADSSGDETRVLYKVMS